MSLLRELNGAVTLVASYLFMRPMKEGSGHMQSTQSHQLTRQNHFATSSFGRKKNPVNS